MKTPHFPWIVAWLIVLAGGVLSNVDGAWWNPGTKDAGSVSLWSRPTTTTSTPLLNGQPVVSYAANPASGSAFGKIASGTKQLVGGAVDIVTLKPVRTRLFPKKPMQPPVWQSQQQAWKPQQEKKPGFFSSIFKAKEPEKKITTVNEFLAQPKPE